MSQLAMALLWGLLVCACPCLALGAADPLTAATQLSKEARELAAKGQFDQAIAKAEHAFRVLSGAYGPEHEYVGHVQDHLATLHYGAGRLEKALDHAQRAARIVGKQRGRDSGAYGSIANNLATILFSLGRFKEAEAHYRQANRILVKELGERHERSALVARNLGILNLDMSRLEEAKAFFEQSLAAYQALHGDQSSQVARAYLDLAGVSLHQEAVTEARDAVEQARRIFSKQTPASAEDLSAAEVMLARIEIRQSSLNDAEQRLNQALHQIERAGLGASLPAASALDHLGLIYILRGQAVEAEPLYKRVLALYRKVVGERHPAVARTLHNLAIVYQNLGQYAEAERFYQKAITVFTESFGPVDGSVAASRLEYGLLLSELNRAQEAIKEAQVALEIYQQLPASWAIQRAYASSSLGFALHRAGRLEEAIAVFQRATALMAEVRGEQSSDLPPGLTQLGEIYMKLGRLEQAEASLQRAIAIREKDRAATPTGIAKSLAALAQLRLKQGRPPEALAVARRYVAVTEARLDIAQRALSAAALGEQRISRGLFEQFLDIAHVNPLDEALLAEMFQVAQLPHISGTAAAVSRMAARFAAQLGALATLVRERQDTLERWQAIDRQLTEQLGGTAQGGGRQEELRARLSTLAEQIRRLDERLEHEFPDYAELTNPRPVALDRSQGLLKPNEALLLQVSTDTGTFVFLLRPGAARVVHTALTKAALEQAVRSLREGLDLRRIKSLSRPPPFDTEAAHYLYQQLFKPFEQELKGVEHIIVVLDGAMQNLPPSLLLVKPAQTPPQRFSQFRQLDFLGRHYAFSVLPSVSSFKLLRSFARSSGVAEPFLGYGDPKFSGSGNSTRSIAEVLDRIVVSIDPELLRTSFKPLPESRAELQAMAAALNASGDALYFGGQATEANVKEQDLSRYRYIAFATHGLMAGEFRGLAEPALVLTPPEKASAADDGLLTASEIATLKLNADWVLLSACNTASPEGRPGAEGLSGLAKAFFYAGSRALLVSHWWIASHASVLLTTGAIQALSQNPKMGRAQALRQAMLRLMNGEGNPVYAHPVFWAPFVVVGEGGASE